MKDDDDVARLLARLGKVDAPEGLERHVLARLEHAGQRRRSHGSVWATVAAMLLACVVAGTVRLETKPVAPVSTRAVAQAVFAQRPVEPTYRMKQRRDEWGTRRIASTDRFKPVPAGFPAPEPPLTEQERLLLQLARRPGPGTIAVFDQRIREQKEAADKAELDALNPARPLVGPTMDQMETKEIQDDELHAKQ